ncbi:hypothetical protein [Actomonas aquatica]|uniref:DUF2062 domain-containing protein n=1 Tax=Actomonas aquatica TaxID=2866162 RepID=A0ABZ1C841_9BACT|nr:hypothetical protein [Opitutus sp. WL0086]WRQ87443.1 hypothetical protein K1X11_021730 [Opitutus sp. WL0086]
MLITRKIGAILRGKATPFQLIAGCVLGAMLGFLPGFGTAPGLTVLLALTLVLLNANLFLAAVVGALAKLLSLALLPLSFHLGRFLIDGPLEGLFRAIVNAPVLALLGVENYATTGGLLLGFLLGGLAGLGVSRAVTRFRLRMANSRENSEKYRKWADRGWVRWSVFLLAGGGLKDPDYAALAQKRIGNPIRPLGAALVIFSVVLIVVGAKFFAPAIVTTSLRDGLARANGATVDIETADLDLAAGRLTVTGLAMADPNQLDSNLLTAARVEADISASDLLRKRISLDRLVLHEARLQTPRRVPGQRTVPAPETDEPWVKLPDAESIDDYITNAQVWRERLAQVKKWLDRITPGDPAEAPTTTDDGETWSDRLERIAAERGYARVDAGHLVADTPLFVVRELDATGVRADWLPNGETLSIQGHNLATQPWLLDTPSRIEITSSGQTLALSVAAGVSNELTARYRGLPTEKLAGALKSSRSGTPLLEGGTVDINLSGSYDATDGTIDVPMELTLHDTTAHLVGKDVPLNNFSLPVGLRGSLENPAIRVDPDLVTRIAKQAGTQLLRDKVGDKLGDKAGGLLNGLGGLLGGKKSDETTNSDSGGGN